MWKTIYEGNANCPVANKIIHDLQLESHQSMGFIPSNATPDHIKTYNFDGRINNCNFDHLLVIQEWSE